MYTPTNENETLPAKRSALPDAWISKIFDHMSSLYGSKFADLWKGSNLDSVKRLWAEKLAGFVSMPNAIKEALNALDNKPFPPTLPEFISLCREAGTRHIQSVQRIEYKPTPEEIERAKEAQQKIAASVKRAPSHNYRKWIADLEKRADGGEKLTLVQVQAMNEGRSAQQEAA